jgi:RsiW-degrading membrane proteinase PrsW (M82 family)
MNPHVGELGMLWMLERLIVLAVGGLLVALIVVATATIPETRAFFGALAFGPFAEEAVKYLAYAGLISSLGLSVSALPFLGIGFGLVEALRHLEVNGSIGFGSIALHTVLAVVMTELLAAARSREQHRAVLYVAAFVVPAALHFAYNVVLVPLLF